jgi:CRISPR-associated endoribonuclease Cas6
VRILINTVSTVDAVRSPEWGHKLRGRIWGALDGTEYNYRHELDEPPGFVTSSPLPYGDVREGEKRVVLIASPDEGLLDHVADDLEDDPTLHVGEWSLAVLSVHRRRVDVGDPGTRGALETVTGVFVSFPPRKFEELGLDRHLTDEQMNSGERCFWRREYGNGILFDALESNLDRKHRLFKPDHLAGPSDVPGRLFERYELLKTYPRPVTLTEGVEHTLIMSKWRLGFEVRDQDHRRHLNLALSCGLGERNALGLGFVDLADAPIGAGV